MVSGIPIGVKICLLGDVHLEKEDSTVVKAIKPRVVTLDKEEETITATWIDTDSLGLGRTNCGHFQC